jgi:large subunit ribosomal protein L10e
MAKLKKAVAHRRLERPYTRYSKYKKEAFVRTIPNIKVVRFDMGHLTKEFTVKVELFAKAGIQIRQESIEAARQVVIRQLEKNVGKQNFHLKLRIYPFHILRENPLAQGAGADRFSTGMAHPFGKVVGRAAQVKYMQPLMTVSTDKAYIKPVSVALHKARYKLACKCQLTVEEIAAKPAVKAAEKPAKK